MNIKELGHIVLYVTNITRVADFYKHTLGFTEIARDRFMALFSSGRTHHEMLLIEVGGEPEVKHKPTPGLYHIGFKIGDTTEDLQKAYEELKTKNVTIIGTADHHVTHSVYVLDPDGNELELYVDVSDEWKKNPSVILKPTQHLNLE